MLKQLFLFIAALTSTIHARNLEHKSMQCDFETSSCVPCSDLLSLYESDEFGCPISCNCVHDPDMLFEGDIKLEGEGLNYANKIYGVNKDDDDDASHAFTSTQRLYWPASSDGIVRIPYIFHSSASSTTRTAIMGAIAEYRQRTCIQLVPRTNQVAYIRFISGNGCYSFVGRQGGRQDISIQNNGCTSRGTIVHEIMHAIGFWHEQSRPDRDQFVRINFQNIQQNREHNFQRRTASEINSLGSPYDCSSIMHYSTRAFSSNGQPTIAAINANTCVIRRGTSFSVQDLVQINRGYCESTTSTGTTTTTTATASTATTTTGCSNVDQYDSRCQGWANRGFCTRSYVAFMTTNCREACGLCGCSNIRPDFACSYWAGRNYCTETYVAFMTIYCRQACNLC